MGGHNDGRADGHGRVHQATGDQHITEHHHHGPSWTGPDAPDTLLRGLHRVGRAGVAPAGPARPRL